MQIPRILCEQCAGTGQHAGTTCAKCGGDGYYIRSSNDPQNRPAPVHGEREDSDR
jgi:DnaJ-class molecular chaperone